MAVYSQYLELPSNDHSGLDSAGVATFISKVWKIVENPEYTSLIGWSDSGKTFIVHNYPQFAKEILPLYFKHSNFNSFVRQLNLYGFRKVAKPDQGSLARAQNNEPVEFWHTNFRRGHPEVLHLVQRKSVTSRTGVEEKNPDLSKVISDIHQMKGRQESIAGVLDTMKQDNEHLRRDLGLLKEKHMRQQRVLNRVIQFLVHMVYKGKLPGNRRRSPRLMLLDGESHPPSPSKRMRTLDDMPLGIDITDISAYSVQSPLSAIQSISSFSSVLSPPSDSSVASATPVVITPSLATSLPNTPTSSIQPQQSMLPISSSVSTSLSPTLDSLVGSDAENSLQNIPNDLLAEFALSPPPASLLPNMSDKMCINGHLDQQQLGLDALPDLLSGQFSVNPSVITDFISTDIVPIPEYDVIDTARLLEFLTSDNDTDTVHANNTALIPFSATPYSTAFLLNESSDIVQDPLHDLLEGVPTNPASTDPTLDK